MGRAAAPCRNRALNRLTWAGNLCALLSIQQPGLVARDQSRRTSARSAFQLALFSAWLSRVMAAVRRAHSCAPVSLIPGLPTCVQPSPFVW